MKYLGIDFGSKKTGLATSDILGKMAFPLCVVSTKELEQKINTLVETEHIGSFIVGYSLDQNGEKNLITDQVERFGKALGQTYNIPVHFEKEFFTSVFARQMQYSKKDTHARKTAKGDMGNVDAHAAAIMLQRFLDRQNRG